MATSKLEIWNMGLGFVRAKATVNSPNETSNEARACRLYYDQARRLTLAGYDWNFARQAQALTPLAPSTAALRGWTYGYQTPADMIEFRHVYPKQHPPIAYEVSLREGTTTQNMLLTDADDAVGVYTADVETVSLFPQFFVIAVAWHLGALVSPKLTANEKLAEKAMQMAHEMLLVAEQHDAQNNQEDRTDYPDASWIDAR